MDKSDYLYDLFVEEVLPALNRHSGGSSGSDDPITVQSKTVTPTKSKQTVYPDSGYDYLSKVVVNGIPDKYIDTSDATATEEDISEGKTAYVDGVKKIGTRKNILTFYNKTVEISAFVSDTTYSDYPYRAAVVCSGVTAAYTPYVMFGEEDAALGILSRNANSYAGGIYIYASEIPEAAISITEIICIEE